MRMIKWGRKKGKGRWKNKGWKEVRNNWVKCGGRWRNSGWKEGFLEK